MEDIPQAPEHFHFGHSEQEELYRRLLQIGPGPSQFYRDACYLMPLQSSLPSSKTHLIAHLFREVESAIRDVLRPLSEEPLPDGENDTEAHKACARAILEALGISPSDVVTQTWMRLISDGQFHGLAHRDRLKAPRPCDEGFEAFFRDAQAVFIAVLRRYEVKFLKVCDYVDNIVLRQHPPKDLGARIPASQLTYRYLFSKVSSPEWLSPLKKQGFFDDPPQLIESADGSRRVSHEWPQADYLKRMAEKGPREVQKQVLEVMLGAQTNYYYIHEQFTEGALEMPRDLAAKWAEHEAEWLESCDLDQRLGGDTWGRLISKLAEEEEIEAGLRLAGAYLAVVPDADAQRKMAAAEGGTLNYLELEPRIRVDPYWYEDTLKRHIPRLAEAAPLKTLKLLCGLLVNATPYRQQVGEERKQYVASSIHRSAIEKHEQDYGFHLDDPIIDAIRDISVGLCEKQFAAVNEVVELIESFEWDIFRRLGLHLLRVTERSPKKMVAARLLNNDCFNSPTMRHEYFHLLKKCFGDLPSGDQSQILAWIEEATSLEDYLPEAPQEQMEKWKRHWQLERLEPIGGYLEGEWAARYHTYKEEFGEPEHPDFTAYHWSTMGRAASPVSVEEVGEMSIDDLIVYLRAWKPSGGFHDPTPASIGGVLRAVVARDHQKYAGVVGAFMDSELDPTYVRCVVEGFEQAREKGEKISWSAVLDLCEWVVGQPTKLPDRELPEGLRPGLEVDRDRGYARMEIARLVENGLKDETAIQYDMREKVWRIIEPLTRDPEPDVDYEKEYGGENMDPLTLSLNTIRGRGLRAMMHYSVWVYQHVKREEERRAVLDDVPNVRTVLEAHLDPDIDSSQTARAVYGEWLSHLIYLDEKWVEEHLSRLFPEGKDLRPLRDATWGTYVQYTRPSESAFRVLQDIYHQEIEALHNRPIGEDEYDSPAVQLANRLMIYAAWGTADLEENGLVDRFFRVAPAKLTAKALESLGRDVNRDQAAPPEVVKRLARLWDWRVELAGGYEEMPEGDLSAFGWWFASGVFDAEWSFNHLKHVLERTGIDKANIFVAERMAATFFDYRQECLECLGLLIERNRDVWFFGHKKESVWNILEAALRIDGDIHDQAEDLVHKLGSMGYLQYRKLLKSDGS